MSQRIVRVTLSDGTAVALRGKLADMVYWIIRNQHKIEPVQQGEMTFNWSQSNGETGSFRPTLRMTFPSEKLTS